MQRFINDSLIPVDSFVCMTPPEAKQRSLEDLAEELHGYHKRKMELYQTRSAVSEWPSVPANALCKVRLTHGDFHAEAGMDINLKHFAQDLEVRFSGALASCDSEWSGPPSGDDKQALELMPLKGGEEAWKVDVQVWCLIQNNDHDAVEIRVKHIVVKVHGNNSDPMVESWLPVDDIMRCLRLILNKNLEAAIDGNAQNDQDN